MMRLLVPLFLVLFGPATQQERASNRPPFGGLPDAEIIQKFASGESHYLLGGAKLVALNSTADQPITICCSRYIIRRIVVTDASGTPVLAAGGIYTATSKSGTMLVGTGQVYTGLTAGSKYIDLTLQGVMGTDVMTATTLYFSLTTANAAPVTVSVFLFGDALP